MSKQTAKVLEKARKRLIDNGWCQGWAGSPNGPACASGAIQFTAREIRDWESGSLRADDARKALRKAIGKKYITDWNDARTRTKKQVLGAFTRAINAELRNP